MTLFKSLLAAAAVALSLSPLSAQSHEGLHLHDPFARVNVQSGAIYLMIQNHADADDRLIGAKSDAADMVMLMSSVAKDDGSMSMVDAPDGFAIPAGDTFTLSPGHDHLMLMGLTRKLKDGETISVTLTFANSGDVTVTVPINSKRMDAPTDTPTPYDTETDNDGGADDAANPPMGQTGHDMSKMGQSSN